MDRNELAFRVTSRQAISSAKHLVMNNVAKADSSLRKLMTFALHNKALSGYPFVLRYAFCRRERDWRKIIKIAAAVHLLQQSSFITDDIFDRGELRYGDQPIYLKYDVNHAIIAAELLQGIALCCVSEELAGRGFRNTAIVFKLFNQILPDGYVGQYLDIFNSARPTVTPREYYRTIALGAGCFFQNVARSGALLAGKPEEEVRILSKFALWSAIIDSRLPLSLTSSVACARPVIHLLWLRTRRSAVCRRSHSSRSRLLARPPQRCRGACSRQDSATGSSARSRQR